MSEQNYISRQITVYKTDKKLIEFIDKLKPAPTDFYAHIHSFGDKDEDDLKRLTMLSDYIVLDGVSYKTNDDLTKMIQPYMDNVYGKYIE